MKRFITTILIAVLLFSGCEIKQPPKSSATVTAQSDLTESTTDNSTDIATATSKSDSTSFAVATESKILSTSKTDTKKTHTESTASKMSKSESGGKSDTAQNATVYGKDFRAVWFSYIDLSAVGLSESEFKAKMDTAFKNVADMGLNTVICQVRANSDAAYYSKIFPFSKDYSGQEGISAGYDPLKIMVSTAKAHGLSLHAWINPYRVRAAGKVSDLAKNNPARKFLKNGKPDNENLISYGGGLYYNPQSEKVKTLILNGIEEILDNYEVDGIHIDDYFYPTDSEKFDKASYSAYKKSTAHPLSLAEWRRTHVSTLVSSIYTTVHKYKNKVFGISPSAPISTDGTDANYRTMFADIYTFLTRQGFADYIAPQLYFGYNYPEKDVAFATVLKKWVSLPRDEGVKLYIGLAPYKINTKDADTSEWINTEGLVARQTEDVFKTNADGVIYYSYSFLFADDTRISRERELIINALKK